MQLGNLARVCGPVVAVPPHAVLVSVKDSNLAVYGSRRAPVAVCVESDCLDEVLVAMIDDGFKSQSLVTVWWVVEELA